MSVLNGDKPEVNPLLATILNPMETVEPECGCKELIEKIVEAIPTAKEIAVAMVTAERNVTPHVKTFLNTTAVESLGLPAGTMGRLVSIEDVGAGLVRWTIDGTNPSTTNGFTTNGPYHAAYGLKNVDLSLVRLDGSSTGSDYSVAYEIY